MLRKLVRHINLYRSKSTIGISRKHDVPILTSHARLFSKISHDNHLQLPPLTEMDLNSHMGSYDPRSDPDFRKASRSALGDDIEIIRDKGLEDYDYETGDTIDPVRIAEEEGHIDPSQFEEGSFLHALYDVMSSNIEGVDVFPIYMRKKLMDAIVDQVSYYVDHNPEADENDILLIVQRVIVEVAPDLAHTHETALNILFPHAPKLKKVLEIEGVPGQVIVTNRIYEDQRDNMSIDPADRDRTMILEFDCLHPSIAHQRIRAVYVYDEELALKLINDDVEGFEKRIKEKSYFRPKNIFSMSEETWQHLAKGGSQASILEKTPRASSNKQFDDIWKGDIDITAENEDGGKKKDYMMHNDSVQDADVVSISDNTNDTATSGIADPVDIKPKNRKERRKIEKIEKSENIEKTPLNDMYTWNLDPNSEYYPYPHPDQVHPSADLLRVYPQASVYMMTMINDLWGTLIDAIEVQDGQRPEHPDVLKRRIMTYVAAAGDRAQSMEFINDMFEKLIKNTAAENIYDKRANVVNKEVEDFERELDPSKPYIDQNPEFKSYIDGFDAEDPTMSDPLVKDITIDNEEMIPRQPRKQMTVRQFIEEVFGTEKLRDLETSPQFPIEIREAQKQARLKREAYQAKKNQKNTLRRTKRVKDPMNMIVDPETTVFRDDQK